MDAGNSTTVDWMKAVAWLDRHKKRLILGTGIGAGVLIAVTLLIYYQNQKEVRASRALANIVLPANPSKLPPPETLQAFLQVAQDHPDTIAASRAVIEAGGLLFAEGKYDEAQPLFAGFEKKYPESPWLPQALLGYAATLEAQRRDADALAEYEKLRKRYPSDAIADEVKLALGRLYQKQNKPKEAFDLFQEIIRANPYTSLGAEAGTRQEELLLKYPELAKTNTPPTTASITPVVPQGTNRPALSASNLVRRTNVVPLKTSGTNPPGTNVPLMIKMTPPAPANAAPPAK